MIMILKNTYSKIIENLSNKSLSFLVALVVSLDFLISVVFSFLLFPNHNSGPKFDSAIEAFLLVVIFSPVIETYLFQNLILDFIIRKYTNVLLNACLIASAIFGLLHYYSPEYMLKTFMSGFLYCSAYLVASKKMKYPLIPVAIAYSIYNFIVFCLEYILLFHHVFND